MLEFAEVRSLLSSHIPTPHFLHIGRSSGGLSVELSVIAPSLGGSASYSQSPNGQHQDAAAIISHGYSTASLRQANCLN